MAPIVQVREKRMERHALYVDDAFTAHETSTLLSACWATRMLEADVMLLHSLAEGGEGRLNY